VRIDEKSDESDWATATGNPAFTVNLSVNTNASNMKMKVHDESSEEFSESENTKWFNRKDLYFEWEAGTDDQGLKGYCVYLGTNSSGNPATQKGLLGTSPISTSGSTCSFITNSTYIDFSDTSLRGNTWLTSRSSKYYFKVKAIDTLNNVYDGIDNTNYISFNFDNTAPNNVSSISSATTAFTSKSRINFTWPSSGASDTHSGILGFQYAVNNTDNWYGENTDDATGLVYNTMSTQQPYFLPQAIQDLINIGENTVYFRVIDVAGNISNSKSLTLKYNLPVIPVNNPVEEEIEEVEEIVEDEIEEDIEQEEVEETKDIVFKDKEGKPLIGAQIEIEGNTYVTDKEGKIKVKKLKEYKTEVKISYNGKVYTHEILGAGNEIQEIEVDVEEDSQWTRIAIYIGLALVVFVSGGLLLKKHLMDNENQN
jgi:hypothetical protein